ncbi:hypothetical protein [Streptomyces sp. NPDC006784]|uniref:hypothetical protein n=1 Tax=Streptomyces sp. NPDC006784 TaxID=3364764 RepID=UPI0036B2A5B3
MAWKASTVIGEMPRSRRESCAAEYPVFWPNCSSVTPCSRLMTRINWPGAKCSLDGVDRKQMTGGVTLAGRTLPERSTVTAPHTAEAHVRRQRA